MLYGAAISGIVQDSKSVINQFNMRRSRAWNALVLLPGVAAWAVRGARVRAVVSMKRFSLRGVVVLLPVLLAAVLAMPGTGAAQTLTRSMNRARKALSEAQALDHAGKHLQAQRAYLRAIWIDPHSREAFERYSLFLYARGKYREGAKAMRIGLKLNPGQDLLDAYLAMHLHRLGRVQEAWVRLRRVETSFRGNFVLQVIYAQCSMLMEEYAAAARALRRYLKIRPEGLANRDPAFSVQLALSLMRSGREAEADRVLRQALRDRPGSVRARAARAELLLRRRRCAESLAALREVMLRLKADHLVLRVGQAYLCLGRTAEAYQVASAYLKQRASKLRSLLGEPRRRGNIRLSRDLRMGLVLRGDASMRMGRHLQAIDDYRSASRLAGRRQRGRFNLKLAEAHYRARRYRAALSLLEEPLTRSAPDPAVLTLALRAAVRAGQVSLALRCARRLTGRPSVKAVHLYYAGIAHNSAGKFEAAVQLLERAAALNPGLPGVSRELVRANAYLARRALRASRFAAAERRLGLALQIDGSSAVLRRNLALVYLAAGRHEEALDQAKRAIAVAPNDVVALRLAARALLAMGKHARARTHLVRALEDRGPDVGTALLMVELAVDRWLDVGSWPALGEALEPDADGNVVVGARAAILDGSRNIVFADDGHLVAIVGMDQCIVVHTADATLVCDQADSQRLKELVERIQRDFGRDYV